MTPDAANPPDSRVAEAVEELSNDFIEGYAAFQVYKYLISVRHSGGFRAYSLFFTAVTLSCRDTALLKLAKLLIPHKDSISAEYVLNLAERHAGTFHQEPKKAVLDQIQHQKRKLMMLDPTVVVLKQLRDKRLAHLDRALINNPTSVLDSDPIDVASTEHAYRRVHEVLNVVRHFAANKDFRLESLEINLKVDMEGIFSRLQTI
jgi:hypothetical protein